MTTEEHFSARYVHEHAAHIQMVHDVYDHFLHARDVGSQDVAATLTLAFFQATRSDTRHPNDKRERF